MSDDRQTGPKRRPAATRARGRTRAGKRAEEPPGRDYEFHFQEGFTGETVVLSVDGQSRARFEASTRMQIGLARIESLHAAPGQTVVVAVPDLGLEQPVRLTDDSRWIAINLVGRALVVQPADRSPGYV